MISAYRILPHEYGFLNNLNHPPDQSQWLQRHLAVILINQNCNVNLQTIQYFAMETTVKDTEILQRLQALNAECEKIFSAYLQQVSANAQSEAITALKDELQQVRNKQFQLFEELDMIHAGRN